MKTSCPQPRSWVSPASHSRPLPADILFPSPKVTHGQSRGREVRAGDPAASSDISPSLLDPCVSGKQSRWPERKGEGAGGGDQSSQAAPCNRSPPRQDPLSLSPSPPASLRQQTTGTTNGEQRTSGRRAGGVRDKEPGPDGRRPGDQVGGEVWGQGRDIGAHGGKREVCRRSEHPGRRHRTPGDRARGHGWGQSAADTEAERGSREEGDRK